LSNAADRDGPLQLPCSVEPFDPERHDRSGFSCGVEAVDNYFKKTANKLAEAGNVRLFVMVSAEQALIGFYAINHTPSIIAICPGALPAPCHGTVPSLLRSSP
jgi:hypothetical protein